MFKKRVFSLLIVTLLALLLALTLIGCRKGESSENVDVTADVVVKEEKQVELLNESRWVTADAGLRMRDSAGTSGSKIGLIPYGEQVILLLEEGDEETIAGASGRWSKVKWQEQEGWVFGGFLSAEQPVVVEESVDVVESSGKTILIDGKEFDESVLYGLYLIEFESNYYQIFELLPHNTQKSYELISEYNKTFSTDSYHGVPDEYINQLKTLPDLSSILIDYGKGDWSYENDRTVLNISYFFINDNDSFDKYKVSLTVSLEEDKLKLTLLESEREGFNYFEEWEVRIIKIER